MQFHSLVHLKAASSCHLRKFFHACLIRRDQTQHFKFYEAALCQWLLLKCYTKKWSWIVLCLVFFLYFFIFLIYNVSMFLSQPSAMLHQAILTAILYYVALNQSLFDIQGYSMHNCTFHWYTVTLLENHRSNAFVRLDKKRQFLWQTHGFKQPGWLIQFILANWASEKHWGEKVVCSSCSDLCVLTCQ